MFSKCIADVMVKPASLHCCGRQLSSVFTHQPESDQDMLLIPTGRPWRAAGWHTPQPLSSHEPPLTMQQH
ncbi:MAG: hypothetical protein ACOH2K_00050 [Burkholderiaceae bacterium]